MSFCREKASLLAVKNAIHRRQSSYSFHCLCERARRSPVEGNEMTRMQTISLMETSDFVARTQSRPLQTGVRSLWRCHQKACDEARSPLFCCVAQMSGWSWACRQLIASAMDACDRPGHTECSTNLSHILEIVCHSWPFTERNNQVGFFFVCVFFHYWIQLTFPHISQIAFDIKAEGASAGTFFTVVEREKKE